MFWLRSALVAICLSDYDDLVRFIFDIFADTDKFQTQEVAESSSSADSRSSQLMTLQQYSDVLKTVLPQLDDRYSSLHTYKCLL